MPLVLVLLLVGVAVYFAGSFGESRGIDRKRVHRVLLNAGVAIAVTLVSIRAGVPWLALGVVLLWVGLRSHGMAKRNRTGAGESPPRGRNRMTADEARAVLGVTATATRAEILSEYRRLMQTVHPDRGGTNYLASRVNEARDVLLASKLED
jgi:predicted MFS family arabinose efflux permease